jgi:hypothetical protein
MAVLLLAASSCWLQRVEEDQERRVFEMEDHHSDGLSALHAVRASDLAAARKAGKALARRDRVPVPAETEPWLDDVRATGKRLARAPDLQEAAHAVVSVTTACAACHAAMEISSPSAAPADPIEAAWTALVWQDQAAWTSATDQRPDLAQLLKGPSWPDRRVALTALLSSP